MNKMLKTVLCLVMVTAVILAAVCAADYLSLKRRLREDETTLEESRAAWEHIAAEKEKLQVQMKALRDELKEAEYSLEESAVKAEEIRADITLLRREIEQLGGSSD